MASEPLNQSVHRGQSIMSVSYRPIPGWPDYRAGDDGSIWSRKTRGRNPQIGPWRMIGQHTDKKGYRRVTLKSATDRRSFGAHILIATAFHGPRPTGMFCCHNNGKSGDNRPENLRWDTYEANEADKLLHGTTPFSQFRYPVKRRAKRPPKPPKLTPPREPPPPQDIETLPPILARLVERGRTARQAETPGPPAWFQGYVPLSEQQRALADRLKKS